MAGTPANDAPGAFARVDVEEAAARLAAVIEEERADVVTIYDPNGGYGHPDHIQVYRVGVRAEAQTGHDAVYESSMNRDHLKRLLRRSPTWRRARDRRTSTHSACRRVN